MAFWSRKSVGEEEAYAYGKGYDPTAHTDEENQARIDTSLQAINRAESVLASFPDGEDEEPTISARKWPPHDDEWHLQRPGEGYRERIAYNRGILSRFD